VIACLAASVPSARGQTLPIGTNINDPGNKSDFEPSIAVNPTNFDDIVVVAFSGAWFPATNSPGVLCEPAAPIWRTTNGGATWNKSCIIQWPFPNAAGPRDQKIAFDRFGNLHLVEMRDSPKRDFIYKATGAAGTPVSIGAEFGGDQPQLAVDRDVLSSCVDRIYVPWRKTIPDDDNVHVAYSTDGGATTTDVVVATHHQRMHRTARIAIGPYGKVYVIYKVETGTSTPGFETADFVVARSDDCGLTWNANGAGGSQLPALGTTETLLNDNFGNAMKGKTNIARSSDAWIDVDQGNGDVVAAYIQRTEIGQTAVYVSQIYVARSTDHGATWTSSAVTPPMYNQEMPEVAVADNGTIGVLYVDYDDTGAATMWRHWLARSFDHGVTWTTNQLATLDPGPLANAADGWIFGDYEGLTAMGTSFYGVFTGQSASYHTPAQMDPVFFKFPATVAPFSICEKDPNACLYAVMHPNRVLLTCGVALPCIIRDPIPRNCVVKFPCPGCPPGVLCPPFYSFVMDGFDPEVWRVELWDPKGAAVTYQQRRSATGTVISFRPAEKYFKNGKIGGYYFTFTTNDKAQLGRTQTVHMKLIAGSTPFGDKPPARSAN
jgi:hypothetical protein